MTGIFCSDKINFPQNTNCAKSDVFKVTNGGSNYV